MTSKNSFHVGMIVFLSLISVLSCVSNSANSWNDTDYGAKEQLEKRGIDTRASSLQALVSDKNRLHEDRYLAATAIGQSKDPSALSMLTSLLHENDEETRSLGLDGLRNLKSESSVQSVRSVLENDPSPYIREVAISVLMVIGGTDAYDSLVSTVLSEEQSYELRVAALSTLASFKGQYPDTKLNELLNSPNDLLRANTAVYLSEFDDFDMLPHLVSSILAGNLNLLDWASVVRKLEQKTGQDFAIGSISSDPEPRLKPRMLVREWALTEGIIN